MKNKIKTALSEPDIADKLTYKNLDINLFKGSIHMDSITFASPPLKIESDYGAVEGFSLTNFIFKDILAIRELKIQSPDIQVIKSQGTEKEKDDRSSFDQTLQIQKINLKNGSLQISKKERTELKLDSFDGKIKNLKIDRETRARKRPFTLGDYKLEGKGFAYLLNKLQTLRTEGFRIEKHNLHLENLEIAPNYSRENYVQVIPYEKDLMEVVIRDLRAQGYSFSLEESGEFTARKVILDNVKADIYRNKLVKDNPTEKKLYSRMLRELSFKLDVDTLQIKNAAVTYEEVQEKTEETGKVFFENLSVLGRNITNIDLDSEDFPETQFHFQSQFMGVAPLTVDWNFKVNDPQDRFRIRGKSTGITDDAINNFFVAGMNMEAKGDPIKTLDFDFTGDGETAHGTFHMIYDNLKIDVLKKNKRERNNIFSAIANLFVSHKNESNEDSVDVEDVERDKKRSFWNYLWNSVLTGLKETML